MPLKKYVTCIRPFFTPFSIVPRSHFVNFAPSLRLRYSLNFTKKLQNEKKKRFFTYMPASSRWKDWVAEKKYIEEFVQRVHRRTSLLLTARLPLQVICCCFLCLLPLPSSPPFSMGLVKIKKKSTVMII